MKKVARVRRPVAEWQHLIAHYDDLQRYKKRPWLKGAGISISTLANKKTQLKTLGLKPVKSAHPLTKPGAPAAWVSIGSKAWVKKEIENRHKLPVASSDAAETIEFLQFLLRRARKEGFLKEILEADFE